MSKGTGKFILGATIGAGIALLFEQKKGEELREDLRKRLSDLINKAKELDMNEVKENLDIDSMCERYPQDVEIIEGIYDLVLETILCRKSTIWISKNEYPVNLVKSKFLKLNHMHLEYVMGCMKDNTTKVRNIKNYLLSALFNAPTTMGSYYQSEYRHDVASRVV